MERLFLIIMVLSISLMGLTPQAQAEVGPMMEVYLTSGYNDDDYDGRLDIYPSEMRVIVLIVTDIAENSTVFNPIAGALIWINISMGAYLNYSYGITDSNGYAFFQYHGRFKDTNTGFDFQIPSDENLEEMTIEIHVTSPEGNVHYERRECVYHRDWFESENVNRIRYTPPTFSVIFFLLVSSYLAGLSIFITYYFNIRVCKINPTRKISPTHPSPP